MRAGIEELQGLPDDPQMAQREPNDLAAIRRLRPAGPRRLWTHLDDAAYRDRLTGALLGRFAGCTLGAPVEFWTIDRMQRQAKENGDDYPPTDYWSYIPDPYSLRYQFEPFTTFEAYTRDSIDGVPIDDDLVYTLLGLLIMEEFGPDFTVEDVGEAWQKQLGYACTAERMTLRNVKAGVPAAQAAEKDNPYTEWIGADIRSDPWGYMAPGWPEKAAEFAYRDAYISHRRQGIYGEMFFSATIVAAFTVDDPTEALRIGLTEIPAQCALAKAVRWALEVAPGIKDYRAARDAVDERFAGMSGVHTINNACLTIWGITIGGTDFTKAIGETVAMGLDNDCTAATVGSIVGAVVGAGGIPERWTRNFNDKAHSYIIGHHLFRISDLIERFAAQAARVHSS